MALSGKHAVAINTIRVRGIADIEPGTVFEHEGSAEANRLFSIDALREANKDEVDLYEGRVKQGVIPRRTLSGKDDGVVEGTFAAGQTPGTVTAAEAAAEAEKKAQQEAASKAATKGGKKDADDI